MSLQAAAAHRRAVDALECALADRWGEVSAVTDGGCPKSLLASRACPGPYLGQLVLQEEQGGKTRWVDLLVRTQCITTILLIACI